MTKFYRFIFILLGILVAPQLAQAITFDDERYPIMYVRGEQTDNWAALEEYKFSREGDRYTIHLDNLSGQFKISTDDWVLNYGKYYEANITTSMRTPGMPDGSNFKAHDLKDLTISFDIVYDRDNNAVKTTEITFEVAGVPLPEPEPEVTVSGTLPVLYVNVYQYDSASGAYILDGEGNKILDNEVIDKDLAHKNYFHGEYWLDVNDCQWLMELGAASTGTKEAPLPLQIKARGNFTRTGFSKKPFKLKLDKKQNLLNMNINGAKSKHWAILAHADDNMGYLRNFTGFTLGERIGLPWTPRQQPIEVVINGDYRGLYFLTESIRVGDGRVPVTELDDNVDDRALVSGGYVIELDNYDEPEESQIRMIEKGTAEGYKDMLRVTFDTPEVYSGLQRRFIGDQFTAMNDLIGEGSDDLWKYMDLDDAARYYLVEEIISHTESYHGSTYMFRDRGEGQKWHFSPLWDCGNAFNGNTDTYFYNCSPFGNTWIPSLRLNATFNAKVKETWQWFMGKQGGYDGLAAEIDAYCAHIAEAAKADARRWQGQPVPSNGGYAVVDNSDINARRDYVKSHLRSKINWLAQQRDFGTIGGDFAEPARDTTPAEPLPSYAREPNPDELITIYFIDDTENPWSEANAYIYGPSVDGINNNEALGAWPGTAMEPATVSGTDGFKLTFETAHRPSAEARLIINGKGGVEQTDDFAIANGNIYYRSGKIAGVGDIVDDSDNAEAEYFDVMGRRVANPQPGSIYIVRRGANVTKEIMK